MKISTKLISAFLVVSVFIGLVGVFSYDMVKGSLEHNLGQSSVTLAGEVMSQVNQELSDDIILFQLYVKAPEIQHFIKASNQQFANNPNPQDYLDNTDATWISAGNELTPFMKQLINSKMSDRLRLYQSHFREINDFQYFGEIFITNSFGANVAQTGKTTDYKQSDESWWQIAKEKGVYVGPVEYDESAEVFARDVSIRIDDDAGHFQGVIKYVVNIENVFQIINNLNLQKKYTSQQITMLDENNRVIYSTNSWFNESEQFFLKPFTKNDLIQQMNDDAGYFIISDNLDNEQLITYVVSTDQQFGNNYWKIILEYDTKDIFESISNIRITLLTVSFIASMLSISFGIYISKSISTPITRLKEAVHKMERNDFSNTALLDTHDEIGDLGKAFSKMSVEIQKNFNIEKELAITKACLKNDKLTTIGQMASRLAHDLRNPLSVIKNQLELLQLDSTNTSEKTSVGIKRMHHAVERMNHQLENVLDFVRIRPLNLQAIELNKLIISAIDSIPKHPGIKIIPPKNTVTITCDPIHLGIVFNNLIYNSIQELQESGTIIIDLHETNDGVFIHFQDSGKGIPEDNIDKIFEPLYTTKQHGTGLGLSSCKLIIEQHGGRISITNNPTTFTVFLPNIIGFDANMASIQSKNK